VRALAAYLRWISDGVSVQAVRESRARALPAALLLPLERLSPERGRALFAERCSTCHGADGQGVDLGGIKPGPLWGPRSWNDGAGMARTYTLAAFLMSAMPYTAPGSLDAEQAQQIAAFLVSMPRPAFPAKSRDYLTSPLPPDAVHYRKPR
jgi:thiosulfate dehydrogenase